MKYKVAVIIPTFNEEHYIENVLNSVIGQTFSFKHIDLMVVDGGSNDNTIMIVNDYVNRYPNIRLLDNPGRIQSLAFNIGVAASDAPFIIRLDAHALYDKNYIRNCVSILQSNSEIGNVGGCWNIQSGADSMQAQANAILNQVKFGIGGAAFRVGALAGEVDTVPFGAFPRSVVDKVGGMRADLPRGEDNEYNARIRAAGYKIYFDPSIISIYYARPSLIASCEQMYKNGRSIGHLLHIAPHSVGLRHLIPMAFVGSILVSILGICFTGYARCVLLAILALYLIADIGATIFACKKFGKKYIFILPIMFFAIHMSYGIGTFVGLFNKQ